MLQQVKDQIRRERPESDDLSVLPKPTSFAANCVTQPVGTFALHSTEWTIRE